MDELPPLPELTPRTAGHTIRMDDAHTALRAYARQAVRAERERCASMAQNFDLGTPEGHAIAEAIRGERERAAQVCERMALRHDDIRRAALEVAAENIRQP